MASCFIGVLTHYNDKVFFGPNPVVSLFDEAKRNYKVWVQYPLSSTNNCLVVLKNEFNSKRLLVMKLELINRGVVAIFIGIGSCTVADTDFIPA